MFAQKDEVVEEIDAKGVKGAVKGKAVPQKNAKEIKKKTKWFPRCSRFSARESTWNKVCDKLYKFTGSEGMVGMVEGWKGETGKDRLERKGYGSNKFNEKKK